MIGQTIWVFDINRRVYLPPPSGKVYSSSGPIYREHWRPIKVFGETSRSWLAGPNERKPYKAPKTGPHHGFAFTQQEVDDDCWASEHRRHVVNMVDRCDLDVLKRVAELVGYEAK